MKFFSDLFKKRPAASEPVEQTPAKESYLTRTVTFGMHPYRTRDEDSSVFFVDEARGIRKMIIDSRGNIQDFPGMVKEDFWVSEVAPKYLEPQVGFRSSFEKRENGWIFLWQLQPDGRYWEDEDGFGGENDLETVLYTFLDLNGNFTGPFRVYQLGSRGYAMDRFRSHHDSSQKSALEEIRSGERPYYYPGDIFPQLWGCSADYESDRFYQFQSPEEAMEYWKDPVLSRDLVALAQAFLESEKSLWDMMGKASCRVQPCMTLFHAITGEAVFKRMLDKFCGGKPDTYTLRQLGKETQ